MSMAFATDSSIGLSFLTFVRQNLNQPFFGTLPNPTSCSNSPTSQNAKEINSKRITSYDPRIQVWLNQGPTAPFTWPLLWIPTPFGTIEGGSPTAIGGDAAGYNPWLCGPPWPWGLISGLPAGLPLRC